MLSKLAEHVNFAALATEVDEAAPRPGRERGGRPPFPTELMVRVLVIQPLYNLSDEQMEFQLLVSNEEKLIRISTNLTVSLNSCHYSVTDRRYGANP